LVLIGRLGAAVPGGLAQQEKDGAGLRNEGLRLKSPAAAFTAGSQRGYPAASGELLEQSRAYQVNLM